MSNLQTYIKAVRVIKEAILCSQYRAASETISHQLQKELPGLRGFSAANIKFMRQFYEAWCDDLKSLTAVSETGEDFSCISYAKKLNIQTP